MYFPNQNYIACIYIILHSCLYILQFQLIHSVQNATIEVNLFYSDMFFELSFFLVIFSCSHENGEG
jgi:hypothetical protein